MRCALKILATRLLGVVAGQPLCPSPWRQIPRPTLLLLTIHNNHPPTHRQHGNGMEVRAEILEALHSAAAEVDEVSKLARRHDDGRKIMARGWTPHSRTMSKPCKGKEGGKTK